MWLANQFKIMKIYPPHNDTIQILITSALFSVIHIMYVIKECHDNPLSYAFIDEIWRNFHCSLIDSWTMSTANCRSHVTLLANHLWSLMFPTCFNQSARTKWDQLKLSLGHALLKMPTWLLIWDGMNKQWRATKLVNESI